MPPSRRSDETPASPIGVLAQGTVAQTSLARRKWLQQATALSALAGWPFAARANSLVVGQPAPPLVLHTLDGNAISTESLRGKVVILTFWATWCEPCREELPMLSAYAERHADRGLRVLGFGLDTPDNLAEVRAVAATLRFPVGLMESPWAGGYGRIWRLPVNFTIDRGGLLVANGWDDDPPAWTQARLEKVVGPLLLAAT